VKLRLLTDASDAVRLEREIIFYGIPKFYVLPYEDGRVEFVFVALSEYQKKLLSHILRKYSYMIKFTV
jgi:hypothetical protein